jgi:hypothetical protein
MSNQLLQRYTIDSIHSYTLTFSVKIIQLVLSLDLGWSGKRGCFQHAYNHLDWPGPTTPESSKASCFATYW